MKTNSITIEIKQFIQTSQLDINIKQIPELIKEGLLPNVIDNCTAFLNFGILAVIERLNSDTNNLETNYDKYINILCVIGDQKIFRFYYYDKHIYNIETELKAEIFTVRFSLPFYTVERFKEYSEFSFELSVRNPTNYYKIISIS